MSDPTEEFDAIPSEPFVGCLKICPSGSIRSSPHARVLWRPEEWMGRIDKYPDHPPDEGLSCATQFRRRASDAIPFHCIVMSWITLVL